MIREAVRLYDLEEPGRLPMVVGGLNADQFERDSRPNHPKERLAPMGDEVIKAAVAQHETAIRTGEAVPKRIELP